MSKKQIKQGKCEQCGMSEDEIMRFSDDEIYRCSYCMTVEGLCQTCGKYIPFPNEDDEDCDMNFAPSICEDCSA